MLSLCGSDGKASVCSVGDPGSIPGMGRSPGKGNGYPLQYSCLENFMDRGAWWPTVHGVPKSWTWLTSCPTLHTSVIRKPEFGSKIYHLIIHDPWLWTRVFLFLKESDWQFFLRIKWLSSVKLHSRPPGTERGTINAVL